MFLFSVCELSPRRQRPHTQSLYRGLTFGSLLPLSPPPNPRVFERRTASAQPAEPFGPLRVAGAAGAAEAGVVRVGAEAGVDDQLAVGQIGLVHTFWRQVGTCNRRPNRQNVPFMSQTQCFLLFAL